MRSTDKSNTGMSSSRLAENAEELDEQSLPEAAHERKRVLNILAQRRYRRRKKERQAMLENMLTKAVNTTTDVSGQVDRTANNDLSSGSTSEDALTCLPDYNISLSPLNDVQDLDHPSSADARHTALMDSPDSWLIQFLDSDSDGLRSWPSDDTTALGALLQADEVQNTTFSDDYHLAVPELDLLRASFELATRMHSAERLWDLSAVSVFQEPHHIQWTHELPNNLQPTQAQLSIAHHPILDIIPWPTARDKLIRMYSMPSNFWPRHPDDGSECSIIRLVYDMEAGGIRIWGADPASEASWEIEESLFTAWWWALDGKILLATNQRRLARGQRPLRAIPLQTPAFTPP